jgi:hypothetical protein
MRLQRAHVWLLQSPHDFVVPQDVWEVVCLAALSAMRFGMTVLYARHMANLEASQQEHSAGRTASNQPILHELWGIGTQDDAQDADQVSPVQQAQARAVAEFWAVLQSFAFLHDGHHEGQWGCWTTAPTA